MDCLISNPFHESTKGCKFILDSDGVYKHVFNSTRVSRMKCGKPYHNTKNIHNIQVEYELNSSSGLVKVGGSFNNDFGNITTIDKHITIENFIPLMQQLINTYDDQNDEPIMHFKNFFDIYLTKSLNGNFNIHWFRPTYFTFDKIDMYDGFRHNIILLMEILANKQLPCPPPAKALCRSSRNAKFCKLRNFLKRPPIHIRCGQYRIKKKQDNEDVDAAGSCRHMMKFKKLSGQDSSSSSSSLNDFCKILKEEPQVICNNVLLELCNTHGEEVIAQAIDFKCKISERITVVCNQVFGRFEGLHSIICCPESLINENYIESLRKLLFKK